MASRSIWTGTLSVSPLWNIPVKLETAVSQEKTELHQVRRSDGSRIGYQRLAKSDLTAKETVSVQPEEASAPGPAASPVDVSEIAKGYVSPDGRTVILDNADLEKAFGSKSRNAAVVMFTDASGIPRTAYAASYYMAPAPGGEKSYALLAEALARTGREAVVSIALGRDGREARALLYANGGGYLVLERLHWAADVKEPGFKKPDVPLSEAEIAMAASLVASMDGEFAWQSLADESEQRLQAVIQGKLDTGQAVGTPREPGSVPAPADLGDILRASVEAARVAKEPAAKPAPRATAKKKVSAA